MILPIEILDEIIALSEQPMYGDDRYVARSKQIYDEESRWRLSTLRLVNKAFCKSASARYFRNINVTLTAKHSRFTTYHWPPKRLFDLSRSEWCYHVRELVIDVSKSGLHADLEYFLEDLDAILPACLTNFCNLRAVSLRGPLMSDMSGQVRSGMRKLATDIFRYVPLLELQELAIALPLTYDYAAILERASTTDCTPLRVPFHLALQHIKHLDLSVYDSTGHGGTGPSIRSELTSRAQVSHPNHKYAQQFFQLAQLPDKLESLRMSCTHFLDMDTLNIEHLRRLRSLDLKRVKFSVKHLLDIVENCRASLRAVIFEAVELNSGTWKDIFLELCKLPRLEVFHVMDCCGYASDGLSMQWALKYRPSPSEPQELLTKNPLDSLALGNLQRHVIVNRQVAGLLPIDDVSYRFASLKPLKV